MLATFDMTDFAEEVKQLRCLLGFTLENVSSSTGISMSTLKLIEKGKTIPKYETLHLLSSFYKTDILYLFGKCKDSCLLNSLYEKLNRCMVYNDMQALREGISEIRLLLSLENLSPVNHADLKQLEYFFEGLELAFEHDEHTPERKKRALDKLCAAIRITNANFVLEHFKLYKYTVLEYKILFSIAYLLGLQKKAEQSNEILLHLTSIWNKLNHTPRFDYLLESKALSIITYNYHLLARHDKVIEFAELGIAFCLKNDTHEYLPLLLARKGIALCHLQETNWDTYLAQAVQLLDIQNKKDLKTHYHQLLKDMKKKNRLIQPIL